MNDFVYGIDPTTITAQIEANINAYLLSFARLPGASVHDDRRIVWVDSGIGDATFNSVVYANLSRKPVDVQIEGSIPLLTVRPPVYLAHWPVNKAHGSGGLPAG